MKDYLEVNSWGTVYPVKFIKEVTDNGQLNLRLVSYDDEFKSWTAFCNITVFVLGYRQPADNIMLVKNWTENEFMDKFLEENKIAERTGRFIHSGFVDVPEYKFDMKKVEQYLYY